MLATLPASRPGQRESNKGSLISALLHAVLVTAVIVGGTPPKTEPSGARPTRIVPLTAPAAPPEPSATLRGGQPEPPPTAPEAPSLPLLSVPDLPVTTIEIPIGLPTVPLRPRTPLGRAELGQGLPSTARGGSGPTPHSATTVDVPVTLLDGSALPRYPAMLRQAGVEGAVWVRFVVNADGRVDVATATVLRTTHPAFAESVRAVLPRLRFSPARLNGVKVPQLVEMPFRFELAEADQRPISAASNTSPLAPPRGSIPPDS